MESDYTGYGNAPMRAMRPRVVVCGSICGAAGVEEIEDRRSWIEDLGSKIIHNPQSTILNLF
jgi:hypothetical protein